MQTANLINSLRSLIGTSDKPGAISDKKTSATPDISKLEPGQRVRATIQEQVSPGLFKVQVAGQTMQMRLPGQLQTGSIVELKVISNTPRLTFGFFASTQPIANPEQISQTSRMLSNLASLPLERTLIESTAGRAAILKTLGRPNDSKLLATALREALAHSGLFYESHQAQWVRGERSTAQLLIEPQNQLVEKQGTNNTEATVSQQAQTTGETKLPIAKQLLPLVQQQLHALETHQLTWTGQVWPGQQMQWNIQGEPEKEASQPDERQWSTDLELSLTKLGDVHIRLVFSRGNLLLALHAKDTDSIKLFNSRLPSLQRAMAEAGINLTSTVVEKS